MQNRKYTRALFRIYGSPCAACKLLRRRCSQECVFAPYFPADEPHKFASVHKVFGASNVNKMLQELPEQQRGDAVSAMVYEANARMRDPVYGCVSAISSLQNQVDLLQSQLALAQAQVLQMRISSTQSSSSLISMSQDQYYNSTTVPLITTLRHLIIIIRITLPPRPGIIAILSPPRPISTPIRRP
nr:LOB domain-containing protein 4-like [Coffea arabica]